MSREAGESNLFGDFDDVLKDVGHERYSKFFVIVFVFIFSVIATMSYASIFVILTVPDHWCHVPKLNLNYTNEEWKLAVIPKTYNSKGQYSFKTCKMYNVSETDGTLQIDTNSEIDCKWGWEYDRTWCKETLVSRENWVCKKDAYATNILTSGYLVEAFAGFIWGYVADNYGRKPACILTTIMLVTGRLLLLVSTGNFPIFIASILISNFASDLMMTSALTLAVELNLSKNSTPVTVALSSGWAFGLASLNIIMWAVRDWFFLIIATCSPFLVYAILFRFMVESPRWLISKGKLDRCTQELEKIAIVNKTCLPTDLDDILRILSNRKTERYSMLHCFSNWSISKISLYLLVCWSTSGFSYQTLLINAVNIGDNVFLSAFWQAIAEIPSSLCGMWFCNRVGRKLTQTFSHFGTALVGFVLIFTVTNDNLLWLNISLASFMKFTVALSIYTLYVHTAEIYPTYLRQSSLTMGKLIVNTVSILSPYLVYLGTSIDARYPFLILCAFGLVSTTCTLFLPETLNQKLPETLEEIEHLNTKIHFLRKWH